MDDEGWPFGDTWSLHGNKEIVSRYEILDRIGVGTYGEVHRARRRVDSVIVALKEIHSSESSSREVGALLRVDHPNVVKLFEYFLQGNHVVLVLEYLPYNLQEVIRAGKGELSEAEVKGWTVQILQGLAACHAASILHRDLKPDNLLIAGDGTLKIADFGQARIFAIDDDGANEGELCGSEIREKLMAESGGQVGPGISSSDAIGDALVLTTGHAGDDVSNGGNMEPEIEDLLTAGKTLSGDILMESQGGEASIDYVGMEACIGARNASEGDSPESKLCQRHADDTAFGNSEGILRVSGSLDSNGRNLASVSGGASTLADALHDARNYFTVEEMVRSSTGVHGIGVGLHKKPSNGSHQAEDPGCCAWFALEDSENHTSTNELMHLSARKDGNALLNGRDDYVPEKDLSSEESDAEWKGQYGIRSEDLIGTLEDTEGSWKGGVSSGFAKGQGDLLQKVRRFIKKRTKRLNPEKIFQGRAEGCADIQREGCSGLMHTSCGEMASEYLDTRVPSLAAVSATPETLSIDSIGRGNSADEGMVFEHSRQISMNTSRFYDCDPKSLKVGFTNRVSQVEGRDGISTMRGPRDEYPPQKRLSKISGLSTSSGTHQDGQVIDIGEARDILRQTTSMQGSSNGSILERKKSGSWASNGPLREMAHARTLDARGGTSCSGQVAFLQDDMEAFAPVETYKDRQTSSMNAGSSKEDHVDAGKQNGTKTIDKTWNDEIGPGVSSGSDGPVVWANQCATGWKEVSSLGEMEIQPETLDELSPELVSDRDFSKSWEQTEGHNSALSDAEGTRWYGSPEFKYSYMDPRQGDIADKRTKEAPTVDAEIEEEWENDSEGAVYYNRNCFLQESGARSDAASDDGSDMTTMVGTRWYKAPELLYGARKYQTGLDIWAVGCIFGELLWGKALFPGLNDIDQLSRMVRVLGSPTEKNWVGVSLLPDFDKICFEDARSPLTLRKCLPNVSESNLQFLQKLLTYDPAQRLSAEAALKDGFFTSSPLPCPTEELKLPSKVDSELSDEEWGDWKDPSSPFSDFETDFEILS